MFPILIFYLSQKMQDLAKMKQDYLNESADGVNEDYLQASQANDDKTLNRISKAERKARN